MSVRDTVRTTAGTSISYCARPELARLRERVEREWTAHERGDCGKPCEFEHAGGAR